MRIRTAAGALRGVKGLLDSDFELGADAAPDRERLRIAADATVSPKLRVALTAAADEDEDEDEDEDDALLAEQLDELPGAKPARARPDR